MKKGKLLIISLLIFLLLLLIKPPWAVERASASGEIWKFLEFDSGQCFTYELKRGTEELETIGKATFWVSASQDDMIRLIVEGNFNGETYRASASGKVGDIRDADNIFRNFMATIMVELPYEVNQVLSYTFFFSPWLEGVFAAELTDYTTDSDIPEWEKSRVAAESELLKVVEYFRANNLQIGERQLKSAKMIGAIAGFGLEVEGGVIELYIFDPETMGWEHR